jgi:hypothetical protein
METGERVINPTGKHVSRMSRDDMLMFLDANRSLLPDVWSSPQDDDDLRRHVDYILSHISPIPPNSESHAPNSSSQHLMSSSHTSPIPPNSESHAPNSSSQHLMSSSIPPNSESHIPNSSSQHLMSSSHILPNPPNSSGSVNSVRYDEAFLRLIGAICRCGLPDPAPGEKGRRIAFSKQLNTLIDPIKVVIRILCDGKIGVDDAVSICSPLTRRIVDLSISISIGDGKWNHVSEIRHKTVDRVDHAIREWFSSIVYFHRVRTYDHIRPLDDVLSSVTKQLINECQSVLGRPRHRTYHDILMEETRLAEQPMHFGPIRRNHPYGL